MLNQHTYTLTQAHIYTHRVHATQWPVWDNYCCLTGRREVLSGLRGTTRVALIQPIPMLMCLCMYMNGHLWTVLPREGCFLVCEVKSTQS